MLNTILAAAAPVLADGPGDAIRTVVVGWATPIILLVIAILAIPHLIKQRFMALGTFALVAVVVFLLFLYPEFLVNIAKSFATSDGVNNWTKQ